MAQKRVDYYHYTLRRDLLISSCSLVKRASEDGSTMSDCLTVDAHLTGIACRLLVILETLKIFLAPDITLLMLTAILLVSATRGMSSTDQQRDSFSTAPPFGRFISVKSRYQMWGS